MGLRLRRLRPRHNPGSTIADERALIAWDGTTEDILMSLSVMGSSDRAAWVMPVPSAAEVTLGDTAAFEELGKLTAPRIEYRDSWWPTIPWLIWAGAEPETVGAPGGVVNVLGRQRLGPFDVTRLAANDPTALADWLRDNGFPHPDGLDENLAPYVEDGWEIVAVQLVPAEAGGSLSGALQPLRLSFASDTVVYPMRLSRSATVPQYIDLYVLADHRMDPSAVPVPADKPTLEFAGHIDPGDSPHSPITSATERSSPTGRTRSANRPPSGVTTSSSRRPRIRPSSRSSTARATGAK